MSLHRHVRTFSLGLPVLRTIVPRHVERTMRGKRNRFIVPSFVRFRPLWTYHDKQMGDSEWTGYIASFI